VAYTTARTFTGFVRQIVAQFCHTIGAEMTRQQAAADHIRLRRIFAGAGRMIGGLAGLLGGFTLIAAPLFLRIWTRGEVAFDPWLVRAFVATIILTSPAQVALMLYQYNNKPGILIVAQGCYAVGTIAFCLVLIGGYSAAGAAAGTGLAEFLSIGMLLPYAATREITTPLAPYLWRSYGTALAAFGVGYGAAWGIGAALGVRSLLGLTVLGVAWSAVVALPAFYLILAPQERDWLLRYAGAYGSRLGWRKSP
jgi:O-antigen/teichoic acid export membrane protein